MKDSDSTALFPNDTTGRFFSSSFTIGATSDVYGTDGSGTSSGLSSGPFGAFTRYTISNPPPHPPPITCPKKRLIKKSIVLASLSTRDQGTSTRNTIQYSAVTQITVSLDPSCGQCCVRGVCEKVKKQVGFDVDSKCYPILTNDDTSSAEYWKSTRKVIAAPKQTHEKLGGVSAETDWLKECAQESEPPNKRACLRKGKEKHSIENEEKLDLVIVVG